MAAIEQAALSFALDCCHCFEYGDLDARRGGRMANDHIGPLAVDGLSGPGVDKPSPFRTGHAARRICRCF